MHAATTAGYCAKNGVTKQCLNDNTFREMGLVPPPASGTSPGACDAVCVLQAERRRRSWYDGDKHYYLNLRQPVHNPQVQEKTNTPFIPWNKQAQREASSSRELLQNLQDDKTFHNKNSARQKHHLVATVMSVHFLLPCIYSFPALDKQSLQCTTLLLPSLTLVTKKETCQHSIQLVHQFSHL